MKKLRITTVCLLFLATSFIAGCTNNSSSTSPNTDTYPAQEKKVSSVSSESEEISAYNSFTEYDKLTTFEYTEKMLSDMNKDDPDFEIVRNIHEITISGHINSSPVKNEKDTMEQVTYSPTYRGGGFSLKYGNPYSINELSPCVPRL